MKYRREIDGLRAVAVIPVMFFHAGFSFFDGGYIGVDIFFVISGFLITSIILNDLKNNKFELIHFYTRRARRILPALFFVILFSISISYFFLLPNELYKFGNSIIAVCLFASNFLFWSESGYFNLDSELKPLLHTWSLSIEEQYYIFFPIFMLIIWKYFKPYIFQSLLFVSALSLAIMIWVDFLSPNNTVLFYMLPFRAWELLAGALIAFYTNNKNNNFKKYFLNQIFSTLGLILILVSIFIFDKNTPYPSLYTFLPVLGTVLIIIFTEKKTFVSKILCQKILVKIGLISYSIYLWHQPLLAFAKYRFHHFISEIELLIICIVSIVISFFSWKYIENPFRYNKNIFSKNIFTFSISSILVFICFGFYFKANNGLSSRYSKKDARVLNQFFKPGHYVKNKFDKFILYDFDTNDETTNVLLVGDSYGQDLFNALAESRIIDKLSLSTVKIPARSTPVFIYDDKSKYQSFESECHDLSKKGKAIELLLQADEVWLASSWVKSAIHNLQISINDISELTNAKIKIFGRKAFGDVKAIQYYKQSGTSEIVGQKKLLKMHREVAYEMSKISFLNAEYIDISKLLCGSYEKCTNSSDDGLPLSYDGYHLTRAGAKYLGKILDMVIKI